MALPPKSDIFDTNELFWVLDLVIIIFLPNKGLLSKKFNLFLNSTISPITIRVGGLTLLLIAVSYASSNVVVITFWLCLVAQLIRATEVSLTFHLLLSLK